MVKHTKKTKKWHARIRHEHFAVLAEAAREKTLAARAAVGIGSGVVISPGEVLHGVIEEWVQARAKSAKSAARVQAG